ncbi:MAG: 3-hydroxyacyl-ACP dehydratase FabZ family protein [Planctomycetaceae bacterium]
MRYLLVDRFVELVVGRKARAIKCVTKGEPFLADLPAYPAALVLESMFQTAGHLTRAAVDFRRTSMLGKVESAEFPGEALPGDRMEVEVTILVARQEGNLCEARATVGERLVGKARFLILFMPPEAEPELTADQAARRSRFLQAVALRGEEA